MSALIGNPKNYFAGWSWHRCGSGNVKVTIDDQSYIFNAAQLRRFCDELIDDVEATPGQRRWSADKTSAAIEQAHHVRAELLALIEPQPNLAQVIPFPVVHRMAQREAVLEALPELSDRDHRNTEAQALLRSEIEALAVIIDRLRTTSDSEAIIETAERLASTAIAVAKIGSVLR